MHLHLSPNDVPRMSLRQMSVFPAGGVSAVLGVLGRTRDVQGQIKSTPEVVRVTGLTVGDLIVEATCSKTSGPILT